MTREYYIANKERIMETNRLYYENNKAKILEQQRAYHYANREKILKRMSNKYYETRGVIALVGRSVEYLKGLPIIEQRKKIILGVIAFQRKQIWKQVKSDYYQFQNESVMRVA